VSKIVDHIKDRMSKLVGNTENGIKSVCSNQTLQSPAFLLLLLIPHFKLPYFNEFPLLDLGFNGLRVLSFIITVFLYIKSRKKASNALWTFVGLQSIILLSTVINGQPIYGFIAENLLQIAVFMLIGMACTSAGILIKALFVIGELLVYSNLITVILFPRGLYSTPIAGFQSCWLLGYKNTALCFYLVFLLICAFVAYYEKKNYKAYILAGAILISVIITRASAGIISVTAFLVLWYLIDRKNVKIINSYTLVLINVALFFFVTVFRGYKLFDFLIEDVLNESLSLSGRTYIWDRVYELIAEKPVLGWGRMTEEYLLSISKVKDCLNAHNLILQYLLTGGIVALVLYCGFNYYILKKLYKYRANYTSKILSAILFAYYASIVVEANPNPLNFILFAIADNIDQFLPLEDKRVKQIQEQSMPTC